MKIDDILITEMPRDEYIVAFRVLSSVFEKYLKFRFDMSQHYSNRVLDRGEVGRKEHADASVKRDQDRERDVTKEELLYLFGKFLKNPEYRKDLLSYKPKGKEVEGIITDNETNINVIFKVAYQFRDKMPLFRVVSIMRRKNFKSRNPKDLRYYV